MDADFSRRIRDEIFHAKVLIRSQRNSTKTAAAALADSEARLDALIEELESNGSPDQEVQGQNDRKAHLSQAH